MDALKTLILDARDGDLAAFGELVRRFQNMVYAYAYGILKDFHLAEDVAQETFLAAYRQLGALRAPEAFSGWLRKIAFKYCDRMMRRKAVDTVGLDDALGVCAETPAADVIVEQREMRVRVAEEIGHLPEPQRVATLLFYMSGYSLKEVADFLGVSVATVKNRLHGARNALKERMIHMVDEGLQGARLPERFADVIVQMQFVLGKINPLADRMKALREDQLRDKRAELERRLTQKELRNEVKAEAFALVREASRRALGMAHYDVQLVAGLMLDEGWVAEVASGEGKSLIFLLPAYLAVLERKRVHVATVNGHLAERDAEMARKALDVLGVTVGVIGEKDKMGYDCDVVYGAYAAFAFDGLRDQMRDSGESAVQRALDVSLIDEIDQVLIDEGRTPVVFAGPADLDVAFYRSADDIAQDLMRDRSELEMLFERDPGHPWSLRMTEKGNGAVEARTGGDPGLGHQVVQALRAHLLYERDREYVVRKGRVVLLNGDTGRLMPGRRWSEGLHQAVEEKERVAVTPVREVKGSLLVEDYFRRYSKRAGLTGTARVYADDFRTRYGMEVGIVPTRREGHRIDYEDRVYADSARRDEAMVEDVLYHSRDLRRPVLIGVNGLLESERVSEVLTTNGIDHRVLDARPERAEQEAEILALAGQEGAVTVVTEMGGRGTDIRLDDAALRAGGLHVMGIGRHRFRHTDDQLAARTGRQGEPGSSRFLLCREEALVQSAWEHFRAEDRETLMREGVVENGWVSGAIAQAQAKTAVRHFEIRKNLDAANVDDV